MTASRPLSVPRYSYGSCQMTSGAMRSRGASRSWAWRASYSCGRRWVGGHLGSFRSRGLSGYPAGAGMGRVSTRAGWRASHASMASERSHHPADLVGARRASSGARTGRPRSRPSNHPAAAGPAPTRSTVTPASGSASSIAVRRCVRRGVDHDGQQPVLQRVVRKMSAKDVLMMALMPHAVSAHGACSRDEPAAEVVAHEEHLAALHLGLVEHEVGVRAAVRQVAPVVEQRRSRGPSFSVVLRNRAGMIWSVSTFSAGSGMSLLVKVVYGSAIVVGSLLSGRRAVAGRSTTPASAVAAAVSGRGEERARALALAPLEVAVAGGHDVLAGLRPVAVHGDAHGAAGLAPVGAGGLEDRVQALRAPPVPSPGAAGHDHDPDAVGDVRPRKIAAAWRRSLMRLLVQEPMNTMSTGWPSSDWPAVEAHVVECASGRRRAELIRRRRRGWGRRAVMPMPMPGLVP